MSQVRFQELRVTKELPKTTPYMHEPAAQQTLPLEEVLESSPDKPAAKWALVALNIYSGNFAQAAALAVD